MILSAERIDSLFTGLLLRVLRRDHGTQVYYITLDKREDLGEILLCDERGDVRARLIDGIRCRRKLFLVPAEIPARAILKYGENEFRTYTDVPQKTAPSAGPAPSAAPSAGPAPSMPPPADDKAPTSPVGVPLPAGDETAETTADA